MIIGLFFGSQIWQVDLSDPFIQNLNSGDETPYSIHDTGPNNDITYSTFHGQGTDGNSFFNFYQLFFFFSFHFVPNDGMINVDSVP